MIAKLIVRRNEVESYFILTMMMMVMVRRGSRGERQKERRVPRPES